MTADFTQIKCKPSLLGPECTQDFSAALAEALYQNARHAVEANLSLKVLNAKGPVELSAEEADFIRAVVPGVFLFWAQEAILAAIGE